MLKGDERAYFMGIRVINNSPSANNRQDHRQEIERVSHYHWESRTKKCLQQGVDRRHEQHRLNDPRQIMLHISEPLAKQTSTCTSNLISQNAAQS